MQTVVAECLDCSFQLKANPERYNPNWLNNLIRLGIRLHRQEHDHEVLEECFLVKAELPR